MDLTDWTNEEIISVHEKLVDWRRQRQAPTWGNKFLNWTGFTGAFAFLTGLMDMFFGGPAPANIILVLLGMLACFSWYKGDKQLKKNINFLGELDQEIIRRGIKIK